MHRKKPLWWRRLALDQGKRDWRTECELDLVEDGEKEERGLRNVDPKQHLELRHAIWIWNAFFSSSTASRKLNGIVALYPSFEKPAAASLAVKVRAVNFSCAIRYLLNGRDLVFSPGKGLRAHRVWTFVAFPEVAQPELATVQDRIGDAIKYFQGYFYLR